MPKVTVDVGERELVVQDDGAVLVGVVHEDLERARRGARELEAEELLELRDLELGRRAEVLASEPPDRRLVRMAAQH